MADHHDAQDYKANGPTDVGFRTGGDNTNIENGVVAAGTKIGVHGIGVGIEGDSTIAVGVAGEGDIGVRGISQNDAGVFGISDLGAGVQGSSKATGVRGVGDIVGVRGESNATGVMGISQKDGIGVEGHSSNGSGIRGRSDNAYGGVFTSNFAQVRLEPAALTFGPPKNGSHQRGEFFVDARGALFYCVGGSPPKWQQLAGPSLFSEFVSAVKRVFTFTRNP